MSASAGVLTVADCSSIEQAARLAGFDKAGLAAVPQPGSAEDLVQRERFQTWVEQGRAGEMAWLTRRDADGEMVRSSLHRAVPWVRSVVLCAKVYHAAMPLSVEAAPQGTGWIARYAWSGAGAASGGGRNEAVSQSTAPMGHAVEADLSEPANAFGLRPTDYHEVLLRRLRAVEVVVRQRSGEGVQTLCYVDTGPVVERYLAQLAGLGWIAKNTCVLDEELGSWTLLGVILTSLPLAAETVLLPAIDRCGSCTRCIDACPTNALVGERQMDASRCISYLTIEKKGSIAEELRAGMGRQIFGCDICQDVCPWNRRAPVAMDPEMQPRPELVNPSLEVMAALDGPAFKKLFRGSPLERTGRARLQRNVAIAMGNSGEAAHLPRLQAWAVGESAVLAEAANWAMGRIAELAGDEGLASSL